MLAVVAMSVVALLAAVSPAASAGSDTSPPTSPNGLAVTASSDSTVSIKWWPSHDDVAVAGYDMQANGVKVGYTPHVEGAPGYAYTYAGLSCGKSYTLGVAAVDLAGNHSPPSTVIAPTSPCLDTQAPSSPSGVVQIAKTSDSATVSWSPSSDNIGVVGYGAYQGGIRIGQTVLTSYTFANLSCGTSTTVALDAYDAAGNRSGQTSFVVSTSACSDKQPPSAASSMTKTGSTETSISLSWSPSTDDVGVAYYMVLLDGAVNGTTSQTAYTISGLACGKNYTVSVIAWDAVGKHSGKANATMATSSCPVPAATGSNDTTKPTVPTNLNVTGSTQTSVSVSWSPSTDNVGVAGYGAYSGATRVGQTAQASYTFTGLSCGKSFTLGIDAYDAAGNRSAQANVIASTSACADSQAPSAPTNLTLSSRTGTSISLTWSPSTDNVGVVGYGIYKGGASAGTSSSTSYTVTGLACGTSYTIGVDAYDASGNRSTQAVVMMATSACADTTPPSAPTNLTTTNVGQTAVTLSWTASTDNVGVTGYDVFANATKIGASTTAISNTLAGLTCGTAYTLGVEAFDGAGNRSTRSTKSVTTTACSSQTSANVYLSTTGNDGNSCTQAAPCRTFDRAYQAAPAGGTVSVSAGLYPTSDAGARTTRITTDSTKTGPDRVTFKCAGNGDVRFESPAFTVQAMYVTFEGSCFRFHRLYISQRGSNTLDAAHLTFDGVHMDTIEITGADDVAVRNSEIGPIVDCYAPGRTGTGLVGGQITSAMWCDPNDPVEAYWATVSDGTETNQGQPFIHRNSGREATNITFEGNWLHGIQTKDPFNLHSGGFLLQANQGACNNVVFRGNRWEDNFGFDILFDGAADCMTLENNWFGPSYEAKPNNSKEITYRPGVEIKTGMQSRLSNWLVRYNSFAYGFGFDPAVSYSNMRLIGNVMTMNGCAAGLGGVTYDRNAIAGGTCGSNSINLASLPYVSYGKSIDFHLVNGSKAQDSVPDTASDYAISMDRDGQARPSGPARDAGADEVG